MSRFFEIQNLKVSYGDQSVLRGVSMSMTPGEILGVVGESGSGKSTAIYATLGILGQEGYVTDGSIIYEEKELLKLPHEKLRCLRGQELSFVAQNPRDSFHPARKIKSQLKEMIRCHKYMTYQEAEEQMLSILDHMSLKDGKRILESYAFELSGGMCQRVSIAMAMILKPRLLFADEPTSALDVTVQKQVAEELLRIREQLNTGIFMVSHNIGVISYMADYVAVMYAGLILESGQSDQIFSHCAHPYTENLIQAVPRLHGSMPRGVISVKCDREAQGCPYYKGCPRHTKLCREQLPPLQKIEDRHYVRCFYI